MAPQTPQTPNRFFLGATKFRGTIEQNYRDPIEAPPWSGPQAPSGAQPPGSRGGSRYVEGCSGFPYKQFIGLVRFTHVLKIQDFKDLSRFHHPIFCVYSKILFTPVVFDPTKNNFRTMKTVCKQWRPTLSNILKNGFTKC